MPAETTAEPALPPRVLEQAADWLMRLHEDGSAAQRARWQRWHDADPEHAAQRRVTTARCEEKIDNLERQRDDIDSAVEELTRFIDMVKKVDASQKVR